MHVSKDWTAEERLAVIVKLLPLLRKAIKAGLYNEPGTINCMSLENVATSSAQELESIRGFVETL